MLNAMAATRATPKIRKKRRSHWALRDTMVVTDRGAATGVPSARRLALTGAEDRSCLGKAQPQNVPSCQHHAHAFFSSQAFTACVSTM